ncbi:MAG: hypothetical protein QM723_21940 [Myxococcaceae bacterium]
MPNCTDCGRLYPDRELKLIGPGALCFECATNAGAAPAPSTLPLSGVGIAAAVAAGLPFLAHYTTSSSVTENGEVVASTYRDYVALTGGGAAVVLGAVALLGALKATDRRNLRLGVIGGIVALGLLQVLRGLGML